MSKPLRIWIEEEYGFAEYVWTYPGTKREFITDWINGLSPYRENHKGEMIQVHLDTRNRGAPGSICVKDLEGNVQPEIHVDQFDGRIHYHEQEDSTLHIGGYVILGLPGHTNADVVMLLGMIDA